MRRWLLLGSALLVASAGAAGNASAAATPVASPVVAKASPHAVAGHETVFKGTKQVLRLDPSYVGPQAQARARAMQPLVTQPATAKINVTYIGFTAPARAAFQAAVNIWQTQIHSSVPIDVVADWTNLFYKYSDFALLGDAGPTSFVENFPNAPQPNVAYPIALANAIAGSDQLPANVCDIDPSLSNPYGAEIAASFNSARSDWYYGTDGNAPSDKVDLESVVLHELGHGLGFVSTFDVPDAEGTGPGVWGLTGDGQNPTIFDTFVADLPHHRLIGNYANDSQALGDVLRTSASWDGPAGYKADPAGPQLFTPSSFQRGSSISHLEETANAPAWGHALMTPYFAYGEAEHTVDSYVLAMFQDMGWPQSGAPAATGNYHVAAPARLVSSHVTSNTAPLHIKIAGVDGVPASGVQSAVVTVTEQFPTRAGIWSALADCAGTQWPDSQNYQAGQTRTTQSVVPLDRSGNIEVSVVGSPNAPMNATVSVDLVGWYGAGGVSYHPLAQKLAWSGTLTPTPVDLKILGVAGVPTTGVTAVAVSTGVGFMVTPGFVYVGPGGVNTIAPTVGYNLGEFTQNLETVPVGTGTSAGKIRLRVNAGHAAVSVYVLGWYGPSSSGGLNFHSAGPTRVYSMTGISGFTFGGLPSNAPVMLNVHLGNPTASGSLSVAPGGVYSFSLVQEFKAHQNASGTTIVTTDAAGEVTLEVSAGNANFYVDLEGWFNG